jgi:hypothetical protein
VSILVESAVPEDDGFFSEPKTVSIGGDTHRMSDVGFAYDYATAPGLPVSVRVRDYDVTGPFVPPESAPDGVATLTFRAVPHPASARFPFLDEFAELRDSATGEPCRGYDAASRTLRAIPARSQTTYVLRRPGHIVQAVVLPPLDPGTYTDFDLHTRPLPVYGAPGTQMEIDLGGGVSLPVAWVPGDRFPDPDFPGGSLVVPDGFWVSRTPVSPPILTAAARTLPRAEPRLSIALPTRPERLCAARAGFPVPEGSGWAVIRMTLPPPPALPRPR